MGKVNMTMIKNTEENEVHKGAWAAETAVWAVTVVWVVTAVTVVWVVTVVWAETAIWAVIWALAQNQKVKVERAKWAKTCQCASKNVQCDTKTIQKAKRK